MPINLITNPLPVHTLNLFRLMKSSFDYFFPLKKSVNCSFEIIRSCYFSSVNLKNINVEKNVV